MDSRLPTGARALVAPFSLTETGTPAEPIRFAGADYAAGEPVEATYTFNSYRLTYRYRVKDKTSAKHLRRMASAANDAWNCCCATQREHPRLRWRSNECKYLYRKGSNDRL